MCRVSHALSLSGLVLLGLLLCVLTSPARAADLDVLRGPDQATVPPLTVGPATFTRWSGVYAGGSFSYGASNVDFSQSTQPGLAFALRNTTLEVDDNPSSIPILGRGSASGIGYGGFAGYNMQFQDVVIGIEGTYTHTHLNAVAPQAPIGGPDNPARLLTAGNTSYSVSLFGTGNFNLSDYGTMRVRTGFVVGNVMPYGFVGFAAGVANYNVTTSALVTQSTQTPPFPCVDNGSTCQTFLFSNSTGQNPGVIYGYTAGAGLDWAVTPNIFVRGEFEFVQFAPIASISAFIYSARIGGGYKF